MTLVVARNIGGDVRMVGDTQLMDGSQRLRPFDGALKCIILSPTSCVAYAGNTVIAQKALAPILARSIVDHDEMVAHLAEDNRRAEGQADYLIADGQRGWIDKISNGQIEERNTVKWIGDPEAFSLYQDRFHNRTTPPALSENEQLLWRMDGAFSDVMQAGAVMTVGGYPIRITSRPSGGGGFRYLSGFHAQAMDTTSIGGSYTYTVLRPTTAGVGAVAVYVEEAKLGVLWHPAASWNAIKITASDVELFKHSVRDLHRIDLAAF